MKKILALVLALVLVLGLVACASGDTTEDTATDDTATNETTDDAATTETEDTADDTTEETSSESGSYVIGLMLSDMTNEFFSTLEASARETADAAGQTLISLTATNDAAKDVSNMEDLLSQDPDIIIYNPVDSDAAPDVVAMANEAGVPVITVDRASNGGEVLCHIASDNVYGGELAGQYIVDALGADGGEVVEIQGQAGASATNDRGTGFHNIVDATDNVEVVVSQTGNWATADAMTIMENALTSNPDVKAVFCHNDTMALGALEACTQAGRDDIIIVGFDADAAAVAEIEAGVMAATIQQLPDEMGKTAVNTAIEYLNGTDIEAQIGVEVALISRD